MAKSNIKMLNRSFRKAVSHWKNSPQGFKSEKAYRDWCRKMAVSYDKCWDRDEICELNDLVHPVHLTQEHYDEAVSVEMSYWDN